MPTDRIAKLTSKLVKEMRARQSKLQRELAGIQAGLKAFGEVLTGGTPPASGRRKAAAGGSKRRARTCAECGKTGHDRRWHFQNAAPIKLRKPAKRKAKKQEAPAEG